MHQNMQLVNLSKNFPCFPVLQLYLTCCMCMDITCQIYMHNKLIDTREINVSPLPLNLTIIRFTCEQMGWLNYQ